MKQLLVALALLAPATASAQLGAAFGLKSANGEETDRANSDRNGLELRVLYDGAWNNTWGWRAELAGVQMKYQRDIPGLDRRQVSENGVEAAALLRGTARDGAFSGLYALGGPVASYRINCGAEGGFVTCDETPDGQVGYVLGLGFETPVTARRDLLFEVRYADRIVAGAGTSVVTLGLGLRIRRN
ncbi:hypothetical protein Strain138_001736 [Pseudogemmatithrix spongiicola]|uniref:Outer membrane protein beta-barrel domain-containing protein n=1 Tax=Pseudogemmatithrix spongiicola TaxID=3062599 RepID=A0AA49JUP3_9BACT|nr:hypothetical protein Strain138_001736 [Gemmatimonadaceae bacterium 'strain 138']WKW15352.1 hypothetical protein Strain318_001735 [Gemmatimonadaceae bacterium 'strain 318']